MRSSVSHSKTNFEGIRSHNPTKLLCLSPEPVDILVKLLHRPAVPHVGSPIAQGLFGPIKQLLSENNLSVS